MPDYSFTSLSPYEFELLSRDLLQRELGVRLESFTQGRDGGTDIRWIGGAGGKTMVQCKHYGRTGYSGLLRALRAEAPRVSALSPDRYIVVTSVGLSPANKDTIHGLFAPNCHSPADVLGRDDLNNLLGSFPEIEQQHFKLWLTSDAVLTRVLQAPIFRASEATMDRARRRLERFVQNPSFARALSILEDRRVCIISGIPGIGKTTLAEVLLAHYVDKHGFQAFTIARDLSEIDGVRTRTTPRIFYYDDFLGTTGFDPLGKNEDRRLIDFMHEVSGTTGWRFVLTTREYILANAKTRYEALAEASFDTSTCVITLQDYTDAIRAQILYNHLYFSDLPPEFREALLPAKLYRRVYTHRNYNPRIIESMTSATLVEAHTAEEYVAEFVANLDNPERIWRHAFEYQLSRAARNLLLVRGSLPSDLLLEDLRAAFWQFHETRRARLGFTISENDFHDALKALDGTFLRIKREHNDTLVSFHNPSIQDFVERRLSEESSDIRDIASGGVFMEQYRVLLGGRWTRRWSPWESEGTDLPGYERPQRVPYPGVSQHADVFVEGLRRVIGGDTCALGRISFGDGSEWGWTRAFVSFEPRVEFGIEVAGELRTPPSRALATELLEDLKARLIRGQCANRDVLIRLLRRVDSGSVLGQQSDGEFFTCARQFLLTQLEDLTDYAALARFLKAFPGQLGVDDLAAVRDKFNRFYPEEVTIVLDQGSPSDASWVSGTIDDLRLVAAAINVDLSKELEELTEHLATLEGPDPDDDDRRGVNPTRDSDGDLSEAEIDRMFGGLRNASESSDPSG
jgi:MoxR-like ATPase